MQSDLFPPAPPAPAARRPLWADRRARFGLWVGGLSAAIIGALWLLSRPGVAGASVPRAPAEPPLVKTGGAFTRGTALFTVLRAASLSRPEAQRVADELRRVVDPRTLNEQDRYEIARSTAGAFHSLTIARKLKRFTVEAAPTGLVARAQDAPIAVKERSASGALNGSLWVSMQSSGLPPRVIVEFSDIFAWSMDFLTEPRTGDRFALTWEERRDPEGALVDVSITSARYEGPVAGRHTSVLFRNEHYDPEGHSLRKAFLHAPLSFRRISSGFSNRRLHPVLRVWRAHHGIDYAAATGTPVVSVGDGVVTFKGWKTAYGNCVQIRHNGTYTTWYGHFSGFARGLRTGQHVRQGQVIGYVGSTGYATGPHLDFRITKNGSFVNFLKLKFPPEKGVPGELRSAFAMVRDRRLAELEKLWADTPAVAARPDEDIPPPSLDKPEKNPA
jgi:murein DD-endopeptidase MepM/ murein hydrolase activator NlpD